MKDLNKIGKKAFNDNFNQNGATIYLTKEDISTTIRDRHDLHNTQTLQQHHTRSHKWLGNSFRPNPYLTNVKGGNKVKT